MGIGAGYSRGGLLIRHVPESRRQRMARLRGFALALIAAVAAGGVMLQHTHDRSRAGLAVAAADPSPFDYFPG